MKEFISLIKRAVEKIKSTESVIQVVSHYDADGITSAAMLTSSLLYLNKDFQITVVKKINSNLIKDLKLRNPELVLFADIGSSYLEEIKELNCDIIITDHHDIVGSESERIIHINPELLEINLSGAGTTYLLVREIFENNSLAPLAIVGTIGDYAYSANSKIFESPFVEMERGLNLFGRLSRPLHQTLGFSGLLDMDQSKAIQFLAELGIKSQKNGKWRTLNDLDEDEKKKLADAIVKENHGKFDKERIFSDIWTLRNYPDELQDAREFATLLNACGRMGEAATGIAVCLGNKKFLGNARGLLKGYKRLIANYMRWLENNPESIKQSDFATYIIAKDNIHENLIGTIVSMIFKNSEKSIIGLADAEDGIKVSARSRDIDINKIISEAARMCGGKGGGHREAAGCTIPKGTEEEFIKICDNLLKEKFIKI